jgi:lipopolysaccharide export LptBFGC system permease protein LptF
MMVTLHSYILRDLLKNLALSLTALTVLLTMGGGLYNVIAVEGTSTADVVEHLHLLIPTVMIIALPIAALFSVTMVYGRLAADNELTACRAAGINVHRLFLPGALVGVFVAIVTLLFVNFVIPGFVQQIGEAARNNLRELVQRHLQEDGYFHLASKPGKFGAGERGDAYTITAERVQSVTEDALREKNFEAGPGLQYLLITNPTLLHQDRHGELVRFTVARHGLCMFDARHDPITITLFIDDAHDFEIGKREVFIGQQQIGPVVPPLPDLQSLSFADLRSLLAWQQAPWEAPRLRRDVAAFIARLGVQLFYRDVIERVTAGQPVELYDRRGQVFRINATSATVDPVERAAKLTDAQVSVAPPGTDLLPTLYEAEEILLRARPLPSGATLVEIHLVRTAERDVLEYLPRGEGYADPRRKPTMTLDGALMPDRIAQATGAYPPSVIVDPNVPMPDGDRLADQRLSLYKGAQQMRRRILAAIHFRLAYTSSAIVTVLMAAILGVMFRGSRALAAFGLSMVPFLSVGVLMMIARKITEDAAEPQLGVVLTWAGLGAVLLVDWLLLQFGVRR